MIKKALVVDSDFFFVEFLSELLAKRGYQVLKAYDGMEALSLLESLGPEGRSAYLFPQLVLDFVYPGLFAICFSLMFVWLYSRRFRPDSGFLYLAPEKTAHHCLLP